MVLLICELIARSSPVPFILIPPNYFVTLNWRSTITTTTTSSATALVPPSKELDLLRDDANVYKLIGPVLVKQDLAEANANVRKRIEYISAELKRLDATLQDMEGKQNSKKEGILKIQQRIQSVQAGKSTA